MNTKETILKIWEELDTTLQTEITNINDKVININDHKTAIEAQKQLIKIAEILNEAKILIEKRLKESKGIK